MKSEDSVLQMEAKRESSWTTLLIFNITLRRNKRHLVTISGVWVCMKSRVLATEALSGLFLKWNRTVLWWTWNKSLGASVKWKRKNKCAKYMTVEINNKNLYQIERDTTHEWSLLF